MKKFGVRLVNGFVLCMLMFVSVQTCVLEVGAVEISTMSGQLLYYDIEMDDDYKDKDDDIYCTCEDCEAQRRSSGTSSTNSDTFSIIIAVISGIIMIGVMAFGFISIFIARLKEKFMG